mgnify:CR=1 FL=1
MKFVVAQETKVLGTKMAKNLEVIEAATIDEAKEIYMNKFPKATNVYGYQKEEETTTNNNEEEETMKPTTFTTLAGNTFTANEAGTHFYMIDTEGKKIRIKKSEYEAAQRENEIERQMKAEEAQAELDKEPCRVEVNSDLYKPAVFRDDCPGCVDCRGCNVTGCVHRDCMRRNPKSQGGLGECPRLDVKVEEPDEAQDAELEEIMEETGLEASDAELERNIRKEKKAAKPRRSKDVAFEMQFGHETVTLTAKQVAFLLHLSRTGLYAIDAEMVIEDIVMSIDGQFADKPMTIGAMISTLCEKGLAVRTKIRVEKRKVTAFSFTPSGRDTVKELGLA